MNFRKKPVVIEAFMYAGGMVEPGWPDGWLSCQHNFDANVMSMLHHVPAVATTWMNHGR